VATFCHQLAVGEEPQIHTDGQLELLHAQKLARMIMDLIQEGRTGEFRPAGVPISVSKVLEKLRALQEEYAHGIIPDLNDDFTLDLFNTYRSFRFPSHYPVALGLSQDNRGVLFEAVKTHNQGQTFLSTTLPGITRGNHYHHRKVERFLVVQGEAVIRLRRLYSNEVHSFPVSGKTPCYIDMPTLHTHNITNTGSSELVTLFWSNEFFIPTAPDTYPETV
jgi:UDP-2-acetamido-2,6-beta-L-arabino-hexul-4-ose reductase